MKLSSLQKGLVGHWPLDEQSFNPATKRFTDKTPNENHGTGNGTQLGGTDPGFQTDRMGQLVRACPFNGSNDNVRIPDSVSLNPINEMTAMAWVKGVAQNNKGILGHYDDNGQGSFLLFSDDATYGRVSVFISDNGTWDVGHRKYYISSIAAFDSAYHLIGFSFNAGTLKLFIDGVEDINPTKTHDDAITTIHDSTADVMLGCYLNNNIPADFFNGDISGAKMWNRALTAAEWLLAYESYRPKIAIEDINKGLVGHWPLDRESLQSATTFADKTPNENVGTKYGSVLKFDGSNNYVSVADNASLNIDIVSFGGWIKTDTDTRMTPFGKHHTDYDIWIESSSNRIQVYYGDGTGFDDVAVISSAINSNEWCHIFTVIDKQAGSIIVYHNGINIGGATGLTSYSGNGAYDFNIGQRSDNSLPFDGSIGDTRIYSRALTAAEALTMYQGGVVDDTDLEAHWKFGDKSGTVLLDEAANNNDGTLTNFADTTAEYGNTHDSGWVTDDTPNVFALDRMGQADRAMSFDGTSDYVDCGNDESLDITEVVTISAWIYASVFDGQDVIVSKWQSPGQYSYIFDLNDGKPRTILSSDGSTTAGVKGVDTALNLNQWYNVVVAYNGGAGTVDFYVDGSEVASTVISGSIPASIKSSTNTIRIGVTTAGLFDSSVADVRIYNRALSQQEITTLYEEYRPKISMGSLMKGLVLDMPLNAKRYNAGNSKFDDLTPYENRGTNTGGDVDTDHTTFISTNSDNVRIPDSESLSPINAMTAMVWVKGAAQYNKTVVSHYESTLNQKAVRIFSNVVSPNDDFGIVISDNGTTAIGHYKNYYSSIIAFDNTWHLIGFSFNAGTLKLFIDGVEDINPTKTHDDAITTIHDSTADVMLGCYLNNNIPADFFNGDISGAKMWNRALTAAEWLLAYDQTKGLYL